MVNLVFHNFFTIVFFKPLNINRRNIATIDGLAKNPYAEADRYDKLVKNISVCIFRVGPGGHLGIYRKQ